MKKKNSVSEQVVKEIAAILLTSSEEDAKRYRYRLLYRRITYTDEIEYSKLIASSLVSEGTDIKRKEYFVNLYKTILVDFLRFDNMVECMEELISFINNRLHYLVDVVILLPNKEKNYLLVMEILVNSVLSNTYSAIIRAFLLRLSCKLSISYNEFLSLERALVSILHLLGQKLAQGSDAFSEGSKKLPSKSRWIKIGAAAAVGAVIAIAAPALIPVVATGLQSIGLIGGALIGGSIGAFVTSLLSATATFLSTTTVGITLFTTGLGVGGASYGGKKMYNRINGDVDMCIVDSCMYSTESYANLSSESLNQPSIEDSKFDSVRKPEESLHPSFSISQDTEVDAEWLRVMDAYDILCIHGVINKDETPMQVWGFHPTDRWWSVELAGGHVYLVDWEYKLLTKVDSMLLDRVVQSASSSLLTKLANELLLKGTFVVTTPMIAAYSLSWIDNVWAQARNKAEIAGTLIAQSLLERQTQRPLCIVAYSLGCLVAISILLRLYELERFDLVEDVVVLGCPATDHLEMWRKIRQVVSGRVIHGYSHNDGVLCYFHRLEAGEISVCGLKEIKMSGIENYDLSDIVKSHKDYKSKIKEILKRVAFNKGYSEI